MMEMFINGHEQVKLTLDQQDHILRYMRGEVNVESDPTDPRPNNGTIHSFICDYLKIGRFVPAPGYKPYAIQSTKIEIWQNGTKVQSLGGEYQCAFCCYLITEKPVGKVCPRCKNSHLTNLVEDAKEVDTTNWWS